MSIKPKIMGTLVTIGLISAPVVATNLNGNIAVQAQSGTISKSEAVAIANKVFNAKDSNKNGLTLGELSSSQKSFDNKLLIKNHGSYTSIMSHDKFERFILDVTNSGNQYHIKFHGMFKTGKFGDSAHWKWKKGNKQFYKIYPLKRSFILNKDQINS